MSAWDQASGERAKARAVTNAVWKANPYPEAIESPLACLDDPFLCCALPLLLGLVRFY